MRRGVPVVEVSDRGNLGGVGSPDRKVSSIDAIDADRMSAELFVESKMAPFVKEINVVIGQKRKIGSRRWRKPHSDYYLWTCWPDAMNCVIAVCVSAYQAVSFACRISRIPVIGTSTNSGRL